MADTQTPPANEVPLPSQNFEADISQLDEYVRQCSNTDLHAQILGTIGIRKLLEKVNSPPIEAVVNSGVVPVIIRHLTRNESTKLQFEAAWVVTNIASGTSEQTNFIVDKGGIPPLLNLLDSEDNTVRDQAVWALGNIAGDSPANRDKLLSLNFLSKLLEIAQISTYASSLSFLRNIVWSASNCCRGKPAPEFEMIKDSVPFFHRIISVRTQNYQAVIEMLSDALWGLSYFTDGFPNQLNFAIEHDVHTLALSFLTINTENTIRTPSLRIIGNFAASSTNSIVDILINLGVINTLHTLLKSSITNNIKREICWTLSNIAAGTESQVQHLFNENVISTIFDILSDDSPVDVKKEAVWVIANVAETGNKLQVQKLSSDHAMYFNSLRSLMDSNDQRLLKIVLEFFRCLLESGNRTDPITNPYIPILLSYPSILLKLCDLAEVNVENAQLILDKLPENWQALMASVPQRAVEEVPTHNVTPERKKRGISSGDDGEGSSSSLHTSNHNVDDDDGGVGGNNFT